MNTQKILIIGGVIWLLLAIERTAKAKQAAATVPTDPAGNQAAWYMQTSGMGAPINLGLGNANLS